MSIPGYFHHEAEHLVLVCGWSWGGSMWLLPCDTAKEHLEYFWISHFCTVHERHLKCNLELYIILHYHCPKKCSGFELSNVDLYLTDFALCVRILCTYSIEELWTGNHILPGRMSLLGVASWGCIGVSIWDELKEGRWLNSNRSDLGGHISKFYQQLCFLFPFVLVA